MSCSLQLTRTPQEIVSQYIVCAADDRQQYERYKGPYLYQLTAEHLQQPPRPWPEFMYTFPSGSRESAYNVPAHTRMLWERMEENVVYFLVRDLVSSKADEASKCRHAVPLTCMLSFPGKLHHDRCGVCGAPHVSTWCCPL